MVENCLLSICISSYNKGDKCRELVDRIIKENDSRFNVVVCDDNSDDYTQSILRKINNENVSVYFNDVNLGACANWYETLNHGTGKYLLHVLDRDYIDLSVLKEFADYIEKNEAGVGYIGNELTPLKEKKSQKTIIRYNAGEDTAAKTGGIPIHPTGFFIRKDEWQSGDYKKIFYNESLYGIYSHSYLVGYVGIHSDVLLYRKTFCRYVYTQSMKSKFYSKHSEFDYWWEPKCIFDFGERMLSELINILHSEDAKNQLILNIYEFCIRRATIGYKYELMNKRQMQHYALDVRDIPSSKLIDINHKYTNQYFEYLSVSNLINSEIKEEIEKSSISNIKDIEAEFDESNRIISKLREDNQKKLEFYNLFYKWMKIHNSGNRLVDYFLNRNYRKVSIYGMREMGELLYDELKNSDEIQVVCAIDKNRDIEYKGMRIFAPDEQLPESDVIVVTAIHYYNEIEDLLSNKVDCPIISLEDVIYGF